MLCFVHSILVLLNFYMDLIRPTLKLVIFIWNIPQAFSKTSLNFIWKCLRDQFFSLDFYMEGDQGSLGVFGGPLHTEHPLSILPFFILNPRMLSVFLSTVTRRITGFNFTIINLLLTHGKEYFVDLDAACRMNTGCLPHSTPSAILRNNRSLNWSSSVCFCRATRSSCRARSMFYVRFSRDMEIDIFVKNRVLLSRCE